MRIILPLVAIGVMFAGAAPVHAQSQTGILGQAQRFLGNGNNTGNNDDRDAYERGRQDQIRRNQAERDRGPAYRDRDDRDRGGYTRPDSDSRDNDRNYDRTYNR